jgi:hypothetical protein
MAKILSFGRSDGGQDDILQVFPQQTSKIWTVATCRNSSHFNCMSASRDFLFQTSAPKWYFEKPSFSLLNFKILQKNKMGCHSVYLFIVLPNDTLVVEPFSETMELWHVW